MIETREDFVQINATLADTVPDEHEELLDLIEALRKVARAGRDIWNELHEADENWWTDNNEAVWHIRDAVDDLPDWIMEE